MFDLLDDRLHAGKEFLLHQQRQRLHAACDGALDHLRGFGDEHALFGFEFVSQLHLCQACVCVKAGVVYSADVDDHEPFFLFGVA